MISEYDCIWGTSVHGSEFTITLSAGGLGLIDATRCLSVECDMILGRWVHIPAIAVFFSQHLLFRCSWCLFVYVARLNVLAIVCTVLALGQA